MKIFVKAKPLSKKEKKEKIDDTHFIIWVKEAPKQGKANVAICKMLAETFKVSSSQIILKSGFASQNKVFEIKL